MKIVIDMNLSPLWVEFFAGCGIESIHWAAAGPPDAPDSAIMDYAEANGLVVFTHDLDFGALLASRRTRGPSVLQIRIDDVMPSSAGDIVMRALNACRGHLEEGALVTIDLHRHRIRVLPIDPSN